MAKNEKHRLFQNLGDAIINAALADHEPKIGTQDGPERDSKILAGFLIAIDQTTGLSGIYDSPQFLHDLAKAVAEKVGCQVVQP